MNKAFFLKNGHSKKFKAEPFWPGRYTGRVNPTELDGIELASVITIRGETNSYEPRQMVFFADIALVNLVGATYTPVDLRWYSGRIAAEMLALPEEQREHYIHKPGGIHLLYPANVSLRLGKLDVNFNLRTTAANILPDGVVEELPVGLFMCDMTVMQNLIAESVELFRKFVPREARYIVHRIPDNVAVVDPLE